MRESVSTQAAQRSWSLESMGERGQRRCRNGGCFLWRALGSLEGFKQQSYMNVDSLQKSLMTFVLPNPLDTFQSALQGNSQQLFSTAAFSLHPGAVSCPQPPGSPDFPVWLSGHLFLPSLASERGSTRPWLASFSLSAPALNHCILFLWHHRHLCNSIIREGRVQGQRS